MDSNKSSSCNGEEEHANIYWRQKTHPRRCVHELLYEWGLGLTHSYPDYSGLPLFISLWYHVSLQEGHLKYNGQKYQVEKLLKKATTHVVGNVVKFQISYQIALQCFVSYNDINLSCENLCVYFLKVTVPSWMSLFIGDYP